MPKKVLLQGTLEEQAAQLYEVAAAAMAEGRYTSAYRYLLEIDQAVPGFRDVPQLLERAAYAKREQRFLITGAIGGLIVLVVLARILGADNEWIFLGAAFAGLFGGLFAGGLLFRMIAGPNEHP